RIDHGHQNALSRDFGLPKLWGVHTLDAPGWCARLVRVAQHFPSCRLGLPSGLRLGLDAGRNTGALARVHELPDVRVPDQLDEANVRAPEELVEGGARQRNAHRIIDPKRFDPLKLGNTDGSVNESGGSFVLIEVSEQILLLRRAVLFDLLDDVGSVVRRR